MVSYDNLILCQFSEWEDGVWASNFIYDPIMNLLWIFSKTFSWMIFRQLVFLLTKSLSCSGAMDMCRF
uniref:Uncharacterized protein n=1 Tax=Arundo donax TaxID=35708 RepID=A0A0A9DQ02_ARUDO